MAAAATTSVHTIPPPFDTEEGMKTIPTMMHPILHFQPAISNFVQTFLTDVDTTLYSFAFRTHLHGILSGHREVVALLADAESTRCHLYRFFVKGSNDILLIQQYLRAKNVALHTTSLPSSFESDWDMSILISPHLPNPVFEIVFDQIKIVCLEKLMAFSHILSAIPEYAINIEAGIKVAKQLIEEAERYEAFRGWKIRFKENVGKKLSVHKGTDADQEVVERMGLSGKGTMVRSNHMPFEGSQFYLARLMANVVAGGFNLPVEIIDIAIPYKGEELELAWEGHTEWHFVYNGYDYRILSPIGYYIDLAKTIRNAERSGNSRRTRKLGKRISRIQHMLNDVIRPYGVQNETIQSNIIRLSSSQTAIGSAVRTLSRRLENRRLIRSGANLFEEMQDRDQDDLASSD